MQYATYFQARLVGLETGIFKAPGGGGRKGEEKEKKEAFCSGTDILGMPRKRNYNRSTTPKLRDSHDLTEQACFTKGTPVDGPVGQLHFSLHSESLRTLDFFKQGILAFCILETSCIRLMWMPSRASGMQNSSGIRIIQP